MALTVGWAILAEDVGWFEDQSAFSTGVSPSRTGPSICRVEWV